jgi:hypothetical protein
LTFSDRVSCGNVMPITVPYQSYRTHPTIAQEDRHAALYRALPDVGEHSRYRRRPAVNGTADADV